MPARWRNQHRQTLAPLAGKRDQEVVLTRVTDGAGKTVGENRRDDRRGTVLEVPVPREPRPRRALSGKADAVTQVRTDRLQRSSRATDWR